MSKTDPKGITPGLAPKAEIKPALVSMRCKNVLFECDSMEATEVKIDGAPHVGQRVYRCTKCGHTMAVVVGGGLVL